LIAFSTGTFAQKLETLTVEKIMRDPKWMGVSPSNIHWSVDSKKVYFDWNPENKERDELFYVNPGNDKPAKVALDEHRDMPSANGAWNKKHTLKAYEKNGDIWLADAKTGKLQQLTNTTDRESNPVFNGSDTEVLFMRTDNLYALKIAGGRLEQLTNFTKSAAAATPQPAGGGRRGAQAAGGRKEQAAGNEQEKWLKTQQLELFDIIKVKDKDRKLDSAERTELGPKKLKEIKIEDQAVGSVTLSPDARYITYRLTKAAEGEKRTIVPDYVTASGFTEDIPNREKVGGPQETYESFVFDRQRDTVYKINTSTIPGIKDIPAYIKDYPKETFLLSTLQ